MAYLQEILAEVGHLVNTQGNSINTLLNLKFDDISNYIVINQNRAVAHLTTKMEQEMQQLWRQISGVCQQMTEHDIALDKNYKQNAAYANGTTAKIRGMENKVGELTKWVHELDEHFNYLLGRLPLVDRKFHDMSSELIVTLDGIKQFSDSFCVGKLQGT